VEICVKQAYVVTFSQRCCSLPTFQRIAKHSKRRPLFTSRFDWLRSLACTSSSHENTYNGMSVLYYLSCQWRQDVHRSSLLYSVLPTVQGTGTTGAFAGHSNNSHLLNWSKSESIVLFPLTCLLYNVNSLYTQHMQILHQSVTITTNNRSPNLKGNYYYIRLPCLGMCFKV
jgi:hypothetical protein